MSAPTAAVQLEVFSDVVCPWCYIGKAKLDDAVARFTEEGGEVEIRLRPFLLQPDFSGPSRPLTEYLRERFGPQAGQMTETVTSAAADVGLDLRLDKAIATQTHAAHQLIESAYRDGGYPAQQRAAAELFACYFSNGEDISDGAVLRAAGKRAGLADSTIDAAAEDPALAAAVIASLDEATQLGIAAVPTFVANRAIAVQGAQPPATLLALLAKAAEMAVPSLG
jgi:predicted DsbA family dithiol-disulfide isomerase